MTDKILSADSKSLVIVRKKQFKANIGVALLFEDPKKFKENYINYFESLKGNLNTKNPRYVFKSKDIKSLFGHDKSNEIIEDFVSLINESKVTVSFVFSIFNTKRLREVKYYSKDNTVKTEKPMKFIDKLTSYFSYITAWKSIRELGLNGIKVYLDNFDEQEYTYAWDDITVSNRPVIFPKGDQVNLFISTADIIVEYVYRKIMEQNIRLGVREMYELNEKHLGLDNFKVSYSGNRDVKYLAPYSHRKIPIRDYLARPMLYVLTEGLIGKGRKNSYREFPVLPISS
ncbi:hypothetical protein, conserved, flame shift [Thermococcus kodakarensis KOD1]|uniref:DUF8203 domain-containing protein n=1 Tax=Thermococcus kodakarensis (strain ATCC BAA-918 / JCM 12380 / KOD1) TaxID=69014 RepID=Q5JJ18_THEKO|nr:hypothetical protein [Thermococcus kodakarensis]WCN27643.1 hypothetical protein POG15_08805 [Thermococcus kodakarensis]WCN29934.1 hypothetical protein POG21_08790 [Thermococcus kodakarensis]BAD85915.1 hypothetical protein, conserved, flame shift [Thermococcus kodakarensis KOD1]